MTELNKLANLIHQTTLEQPFDMPLEMASIDGVKIRMVNLNLRERETVILIAFPQYYCLFTHLGRTKNRIQPVCYDLPGFAGSDQSPNTCHLNFRASFWILKHFE